MPMARWFVDRLPRPGIPSVSLRKVLPDARFLGCADWSISGCTDDHRWLEPGQIFVAARESRPGYDGHLFVREALERGAAGVVVERACEEAGRLQVVVPDAMIAYGRICHALAGDPSRQLVALGITGSFGKTITAMMARSIIEAAGDRCGLVGALGFYNGTSTRALGAGFDYRGGSGGTDTAASGPITALERMNREPGAFTPGAASLADLLAELVENRCKGALLEVSGEALVHRSFEGVAFHAALVTDVSAPFGFPPDALVQKRRAKARLFRQIVRGGVAVVNADDPHAEVLGAVNLDARRVAFALDPPSSARGPIDVRARIERMDNSGTRMTLQGFEREATIHLPLVGPRAAHCALAAATLAWAIEIDRASVVAGLEAVQSVAGCLEAVVEGQDFDVRIDGAKSPTALFEALAALRAVAAGRVHLVLGGEGVGDRNERRRLAEVAENGADRVMLTLGSPRAADPDQILDDLLSGFRHPGKVRVLPDRRSAINTALADARAGDVVLIAGKGRQAYQIFAKSVVPFDDHAVAREYVRAHVRTPVPRSA
jgi:UDP-N-acetylmuramoyl-L-alanyl-D-glutamate--2,6-diaminopimelate ligase